MKNNVEKNKKKRFMEAYKKKVIIEKMRNKGSTLEEIGEKLGVTRERVRQIEMEMGFPKRGHPKMERLSIPCSNPACKEILHVLPTTPKKYCSKKCRRACRVRKTIAEKRAYWNMRTKNYYHTVLKLKPNFKELVRERNLKYYKKNNKK